ncbi:MAG: Mu transposase C-terminal domain-containing protein [Ruminococcus sp.]|nr:Mu transposase C-terminal domain-containing protein [Ruminococcus sp.]
MISAENSDLLTVRQTAELKGCSVRYIQQLCKNGKIPYILQKTEKNRDKFMIPVSELPDTLKAKYYSEIRKKNEEKCQEKKPKKIKNAEKSENMRDFEELSEEERQRVNFWCGLLDEWQVRREEFEKKTEFDANFIGECRLRYRDIQISTAILYRKFSAYKRHDFDGILGKRGGHNRGRTAIPEPVWNAFLWYWLDENKPSASLCYRNTIAWAKEFYPELLEEIPSERTFLRHIKSDVPESLKILMRDGEKAFSDRCMPYIMRMYDELSANDCWIADNHTLDIQSVDEENKIHRLYLTAFLDAKSGVLTGWNVTDKPSSQSTILALRHGIMRFGIPHCIYVDNGREFLTNDIGGKGNRTRKNSETSGENPPTILQKLGIEMRNATVRNAKAKPIERTFCTLKNQFSKLFSGFCGGKISERPESLKKRIKSGKIPRDFEVREILETWIDGDYNLQKYGGNENEFKGLSRIEVWNKTCKSVKMTTESDLNLMLMRTTKVQKIKRNGVCISVCGEKLWYMNPLETVDNIGREVYVRYDPADLRKARIYDGNSDRYLFTWELADVLMVDYLTKKKEEISDAEEFIKMTKKMVKKKAEGISEGLSDKQKISLLDMNVRRAMAEKDEKFIINMPKKIVAVMADEKINDEKNEEENRTAVVIDLRKMGRNAKLRKG